MGRDDSWLATVPSAVLSLQYSLSEKATQKDPKWRNCRLLPIVNLMTDSESRSMDSYLSIPVTIRLFHLVSEIFVCDRQTDGQCSPIL